MFGHVQKIAHEMTQKKRQPNQHYGGVLHRVGAVLRNCRFRAHQRRLFLKWHTATKTNFIFLTIAYCKSG